MPLYQESVAAAAAVVGYDLLTNVPDARQSGANRALRSVALTGSAAPGDTRIAVMIGGVRIGRIYNTATGFPTQDAAKIGMGDAYIPPGSPLSLIVEDAPATNPINPQVEIVEF